MNKLKSIQTKQKGEVSSPSIEVLLLFSFKKMAGDRQW